MKKKVEKIFEQKYLAIPLQASLEPHMSDWWNRCIEFGFNLAWITCSLI